MADIYYLGCLVVFNITYVQKIRIATSEFNNSKSAQLN